MTDKFKILLMSTTGSSSCKTNFQPDTKHNSSPRLYTPDELLQKECQLHSMTFS